ncbi:MAG TPA: hypothetical protein ENJ20_04880, partial [Bacteroidetes bacterium]|nr:hypothetical protein [Bacteroidota bacterium]
CNCLTDAGNMLAGNFDVCGDASAPVEHDGLQTLDTDDALCFILHSGDPQSPIATNPTADNFSFDPATMTIGTQYFICPVAGNDDGSGCVDFADPCLSIGGCAQVTFREIPTATLVAGGDICTGQTGRLTFEFTGAGPWTFEFQDDSGATTTLEAGSSPFLADVAPDVSTDYTIINMVGKFCDGMVNGTATINVHEAPTATVLHIECNSTSTEYTVAIDISGGDTASYSIIPNNGTLSGNVFTSNSYADGDSYSFEIDDQYQCGPTVISGGFICDCLTDAGAMPTGMLNYCLGDLIEGDTTMGETLDGDDNLLYVLHTGSGNSLGTVIATNDEPVFDFDPNTMSTGTTYYLSAVAGNGLPNGDVDLNDFCLSVAPGTPVLFNDLPEATISGSTTLCEGDATDVSFSLAGTGPFNIIFEIDGDEQPPQVVPAPGQFDITINPAQTVTYTLVSIEDLGTGCSNTAEGEIEVVVNQPVEAGTPLNEVEVCENVHPIIGLFENIVGFDDNGTWTDDNGNVYPNGTLNTAMLPVGTHTFTYTVLGEAPCPDDAVSVNVTVHPAPVADAGNNVQFGCDLSPVQIGGPGTTPGMSYSWEGDVSNPNIANPEISGAGEFILTVTTPFGCVERDTVYSFVSNDQPVPVIVTADISCFGMNDGFITIESISGGQPPYLCSFNGGSFSDTKTFSSLSEGNYSIVIQDAVGCQSAVFNFTITEPEEVTVNLVPDIEGIPPVADYNAPFVIEAVTTPAFGEMDTVIWTYSGNFNDSLFCASCQTNTVALDYQTTFGISVAENGCTDEDQLTVFVRRDHLIYVPNAFTPNNRDDEENEFFRLYATEGEVAKVRSFLIFNRWGESVFQYYNFDIDDPDGHWDGTHRGQPLNPAVFVWTAEVEFKDGVVEFYKGDVTLIK